jgi:hypothetical protein
MLFFETTFWAKRGRAMDDKQAKKNQKAQISLSSGLT